jgi:hypothetical protein
MHSDVLNSMLFEQAQERILNTLNEYSGRLSPAVEYKIKQEIKTRYSTLTIAEINRAYGLAVKQFSRMI